VDALKLRVLDGLGPRKVPKQFQIVPQLPRNSLGKVVKRELVENYLNARKEI
jgi:acyl-coenzyme A synthetase/AMP-(fatty) acid ligase